MLHDQDPVRPVAMREAVVAVAGLECGRDELPYVAADKEPHDEDGDPGKTSFLVSIVAAVVDDAGAMRDAAADATPTARPASA